MASLGERDGRINAVRTHRFAFTDSRATIHRGAVEAMRAVAPLAKLLSTQQHRGDNGRIVLPTGVTLGIDRPLHVILKLLKKRGAKQPIALSILSSRKELLVVVVLRQCVKREKEGRIFA